MTKLVLTALLYVALLLAADAGAAKRDAIAAMQRGDYAAAEKMLRGVAVAPAADGEAMSLLGVALDYQKKLAEAGEFHRKAVTLLPRSTAALTNYANHLILAGDAGRAETTFARIVAIDPANSAANRQLARMAVERKKGADALGYLKHLRDAEQGDPDVELLRLEALYQTGQKGEADAVANKLVAAARNDLNLTVAVGRVLTNARQFEVAESLFAAAVAKNPAHFDLLYNLGVVALDAGHAARASEVLNAALRLQPENVDVLYSLAFVYDVLGQKEAAVTLLAHAAKLAPSRPDVQKLLAKVTYGLNAFDDAMAAWDRYVKLQPDDDEGRRERAQAALRVQQFAKSVADLKWYVSRHPADAEARVELGVSQSKIDGEAGLAELNRALQLKPDLTEGHAARGALYYTLGRPKDALADLEFTAAHRPDDAGSLDRLGQTYQSLNRPADAVRVLRKAAALAKEDAQVQLHLGVALNAAGVTEEAKVVMERFRQLGPARDVSVPAGLVEYLSLTPEQQRADYRARVEKAAKEQVTDGAAQVRYLQLLLEDGKTTEALEAARRIAGLKPATGLLTDAGQALLESGQLAAAKEILEQIPEAQRPGVYYLSLAETGNDAALERAISAAAKEPQLYRQIVRFLVKNNRYAEALKVLDGAPEDRDLLLLKTTTLAMSGDAAGAADSAASLQMRWPEWQAGWIVRGAALAAQSKVEEARQAVQTGIQLGAHSAETRAFLDVLGRASAARDFIAFLEQKPGDEW